MNSIELIKYNLKKKIKTGIKLNKYNTQLLVIKKISYITVHFESS